MIIPLTTGQTLSKEDWDSVRLNAIFECCKWDIQSGDHSVLADFPLFIEESEWDTISDLAETLADEAIRAEHEIFSRRDLQAELGIPTDITRTIRRCTADDLPLAYARVMRFDFHLTLEGWRISEVNADVPGGFIEASGFTESMARYFPQVSPLPNPAAAYVESLQRCAGQNALIGFVHATAHVDDAQVMHYLAQRARERGMRAVLLSPEHIFWDSNRSKIVSSFASGDPDMLVRFFPAEWLPRLRPESQWKPWFCGGKTPMSNPGTAIFIQSKRFPLIWGEINQAMATWRALMPESRCPSELKSSPAGEWVFKPVFGRVGEDVAIAGITEDNAYKKILAEVRHHPKDWVAQRRFESVSLPGPAGPIFPCIGIFTLDCKTVGAYGRIAKIPLIDHAAQDIAVLLSAKGSRQND